jgi:hypothetical protein
MWRPARMALRIVEEGKFPKVIRFRARMRAEGTPYSRSYVARIVSPAVV